MEKLLFAVGNDPIDENAVDFACHLARLTQSSADTFSKGDEPIPSAFVKQMIHDSACPVILTTESFERIDNIVFCYDGGRTSLYTDRSGNVFR